VLVVCGRAGGWQDGAVGVRDRVRVGVPGVAGGGVWSQRMELAFAALQQFVRADARSNWIGFPSRSGNALGVAFGLRGGRRAGSVSWWGWRC